MHSDKAKMLSAIFYFSVQLAICIEKKRQPNEDFQDCIGSEGHMDYMTEVTTYFVLSFNCHIDYCGSSTFFKILILFHDYGLNWIAGGKCSWGWLIQCAETQWKFFWESWQVNLASESLLGYFNPNLADSKYLCWLSMFSFSLS